MLFAIADSGGSSLSDGLGDVIFNLLVFTSSDKTLTRKNQIMVPDTEANNTGRQGIPRFLNLDQSVIADAHPPQALQPTDCPFHHPAHLAQTAAMLRPALIDLGFNAQPAEQPAGGLTVVAGVGVQLVRQFFGAADLPTDVREVEDDRDDLLVVAGVGPRRVDGQRDAMPIDHERMFRAFFPAIDRAGAGLLPTAERPHDDPIDDD